MKRSKLVLGVIALAAVAGALVFYVSKRRPPPAPISSTDQETLSGYVKFKACEATACNDVVCEGFSDGQTKGSPAHVVRCRWSDRRDPTKPRKCAYVHYMGPNAAGNIGNLFLSARTSSDDCQRDKAFNDLIKSIGYTGALP